MTRPLRVAQIGCGAFAECTDLPNFTDHPDIECRWCCDTDEARARALAERFDVPRVATDYREVMGDPEVDFVKIATSHEIHLPIIEAAAAAGKHVFCEKPLAMERREGLEILRAVRRSGITLAIDYNRRQAPALRALRERWRAHRAEPKHNPWRYVETAREPYPDERRTQLLVRIQDDTLSYRPVHLDPLRGGGQILGESVHWLDLACWFFAPQLPVEIQAWGSTRFTHGIHLAFSEGDAATLLFHCGGTFDYPKELYEVTLEGALFRSECFVENQCFGTPDAPARETFPLWRDPLPEVGAQGGLAGFLEKHRHRVRDLANSKQGHATLAVDKGHAAMCDAFVRALREEAPPPCDALEGYRATHLARLAIRSIETRQALPVPLESIVFTVL